MKKKTPTSDVNVTAFQILQAAIGEQAKEPAKKKKPATPEKNPAAVALGRLGGLKGGNARAAKLTKRERVQIAKKAAKSRWGTSSN